MNVSCLGHCPPQASVLFEGSMPVEGLQFRVSVWSHGDKLKLLYIRACRFSCVGSEPFDNVEWTSEQDWQSSEWRCKRIWQTNMHLWLKAISDPDPSRFERAVYIRWLYMDYIGLYNGFENTSHCHTGLCSPDVNSL